MVECKCCAELFLEVQVLGINLLLSNSFAINRLVVIRVVFILSLRISAGFV